MSTTILQHPGRIRGRQHPKTENDLRRELDAHLEALVARQDLYLQLQAEIEDGGDDETKSNSQDVLEILIAEDREALERKVRLYKRFKGHPFAASIPDRSSERYQKLLDTASALKTLWPAEQFATDILGVQLHRRGNRLVGRCPFHQDDTPSFTVYPDSDTFWCFGCFQRGDGIDIFAMLGRWQNIPGFRQQVEWLASFSRGWFGGDS